MVIIYTSSRRAVLRRFAALLIAPQRFVCYFAMCRYATPHRSLHRSSVRRNDLFVTTLRTPRLGSARLRVSRCAAIQRYDLLCTTQRTPLLTSPLCIVLPRSTKRRSATRLNDLFVTTQRTALRSSPHRHALRHSSLLRSATQLNDLFVTMQLNAAQCNSSGLDAPRLIASLLNSTICLLQRNSTNCGSTYRPEWLRTAPRLNSTRRFVCYFAPQRSSAIRIAPHRASTQLCATN